MSNDLHPATADDLADSRVRRVFAERGSIGLSFIIGRAHCEPCGTVAAVIRHPDVCEVHCPRCGELATIGASGDEC
jgi:hypothetical protein